VGPVFHIVDSTYSLFIERVGTEAINGIGGEGNNAAFLKARDSEFYLFIDGRLLWHLG